MLGKVAPRLEEVEEVVTDLEVVVTDLEVVAINLEEVVTDLEVAAMELRAVGRLVEDMDPGLVEVVLVQGLLLFSVL